MGAPDKKLSWDLLKHGWTPNTGSWWHPTILPKLLLSSQAAQLQTHQAQDLGPISSIFRSRLSPQPREPAWPGLLPRTPNLVLVLSAPPSPTWRRGTTTHWASQKVGDILAYAFLPLPTLWAAITG